MQVSIEMLLLRLLLHLKKTQQVNLAIKNIHYEFMFEEPRMRLIYPLTSNIVFIILYNKTFKRCFRRKQFQQCHIQCVKTVGLILCSDLNLWSIGRN